MMTTKIRINRGFNSAISKIVEIDRSKSATGFIEDMQFGDTVQPSLVKLSDEDCWNLYKGNDHILSTVNRIVRDCVKVPMRIVPRDRNKKITSAVQRRIDLVQKFFDNPNSNKESTNDIREKVIRDLLVFGRGTIEKVNSGNRIIEMYAQNPKGITIRSDQSGNLKPERTYKLSPSIAEEPIYWDIDEMIYMVLNPISNSLYGIKILDGIANTVASDILRAAHNSNYFVNGAEAAGLLGLEGMNNKELEKFRAYWKSNFKGTGNAHKTAAVNVPVKYVRMAITNRDLEFNEYGKELRGKIYAAYGMQPVIMGMVDGTTGKLNSGEQIELYKDGALRPILSKESFYYTTEIIYMGFGFDDIKVDFPSLDMIDVATQSATDIAEVGSGLRTINEVRLRRGDPPVNWGDTPISTMPGGGQIDPNTGRLLPATQKPKPSSSSQAPRARKYLKKFLASAKVKIGILNLKQIELAGAKIKKNVKIKKVNGYKLRYYKLPKGILQLKLNSILDNMLDVSDLDKNTLEYKYMKSIKSRVKYVVFRSLVKGNVSSIIRQIDTIFQEEITQGKI